MKAKKIKSWVTVSGNLKPNDQDRSLVQAVCLGNTEWAIFGDWSIGKKLIQNTPNFGIWTGTLKRAYFAAEHRLISLFTYSKLIFSGRYIVNVTP